MTPAPIRAREYYEPSASTLRMVASAIALLQVWAASRLAREVAHFEGEQDARDLNNAREGIVGVSMLLEEFGGEDIDYNFFIARGIVYGLERQASRAADESAADDVPPGAQACAALHACRLLAGLWARPETAS